MQWPGQAQVPAEVWGAELALEAIEEGFEIDVDSVVKLPATKLDVLLLPPFVSPVVLPGVLLPPEHSPGALSTG